MIEVKKPIAVYGLTNSTGVAILDVNDVQVIYLDATGKKRHAKIYGERPYFKYCGGFRIYLDECIRV